jgi:hypothetical protein
MVHLRLLASGLALFSSAVAYKVHLGENDQACSGMWAGEDTMIEGEVQTIEVILLPDYMFSGP